MSTIVSSVTVSPSAVSKQLDILEYGSLRELRVLLDQLDHHARAGGLRVLIVLDSRFSGNLASLARRKCRAFRLVFTTSAGQLPGTHEAYGEEGVSWKQIVIEQGIEESIRREIRDTQLSERLFVFWPNWL